MAKSNFLRTRIIIACEEGIDYWKKYGEKTASEEIEKIINECIHKGFRIFGITLIEPNTRDRVIELLERPLDNNTHWSISNRMHYEYFYYKNAYEPRPIKKLQKLLDLCNNSVEYYVTLDENDVDLIKEFLKF